LFFVSEVLSLFKETHDRWQCGAESLLKRLVDFVDTTASFACGSCIIMNVGHFEERIKLMRGGVQQQDQPVY
jgi:hypothetical protein